MLTGGGGGGAGRGKCFGIFFFFFFWVEMVWDFNLANIWLVFGLGFHCFSLRCAIFFCLKEKLLGFFSNRWITFFFNTFHSSNANWIWAFGGLGLLGFRV